MPISTTSRKAGPYPGNGVARDFSFNFKIFSSDELRVSVTNAAGAEQVLVFNNDYTVALNPDQDTDAGGIVSLGTPLASTDRLVILSAVEMLQPIDLTNQGGFYPDVVNEGFDRVTALVQQLSERSDRSVTVPPSTPPGFDISLPEPAEGSLIGWGAGGMQNIDPADLISVVAYGQTHYDVFDGDGTSTVFYLTRSPAAQNNLRVSVDGVVQAPSYDFSWGGGVSLVFASPPPLGTRILVQYGQALVEEGSAAVDGNNIAVPAWRAKLGLRADGFSKEEAQGTTFDASNSVLRTDTYRAGGGKGGGTYRRTTAAAVLTRSTPVPLTTTVYVPLNGFEGSNVFFDLSASARPISAFGQAVVAEKRILGQRSTYFDGAGDRVDIGGALPSWAGDFTVDMFCEFEDLAATRLLFAQQNNSTNYMQLSARADGSVQFEIRAANTAHIDLVSAPAAVAPGAVHHIAVVRLGDKWSLYVDRLEVAAVTKAYTVLALTSAPRLGTAVQGHMKGWISRFRMQSVAMWTNGYKVGVGEFGLPSQVAGPPLPWTDVTLLPVESFFRSPDGAVWLLDEEEVTPAHFGAVGGADMQSCTGVDDGPALRAMDAYMTVTGAKGSLHDFHFCENELTLFASSPIEGSGVDKCGIGVAMNAWSTGVRLLGTGSGVKHMTISKRATEARGGGRGDRHCNITVGDHKFTNGLPVFVDYFEVDDVTLWAASSGPTASGGVFVMHSVRGGEIGVVRDHGSPRRLTFGFMVHWGARGEGDAFGINLSHHNHRFRVRHLDFSRADQVTVVSAPFDARFDKVSARNCVQALMLFVGDETSAYAAGNEALVMKGISFGDFFVSDVISGSEANLFSFTSLGSSTFRRFPPPDADVGRLRVQQTVVASIENIVFSGSSTPDKNLLDFYVFEGAVRIGNVFYEGFAGRPCSISRSRGVEINSIRGSSTNDGAHLSIIRSRDVSVKGRMEKPSQTGTGVYVGGSSETYALSAVAAAGATLIRLSTPLTAPILNGQIIRIGTQFVEATAFREIGCVSIPVTALPAAAAAGTAVISDQSCRNITLDMKTKGFQIGVDVIQGKVTLKGDGPEGAGLSGYRFRAASDVSLIAPSTRNNGASGVPNTCDIEVQVGARVRQFGGFLGEDGANTAYNVRVPTADPDTDRRYMAFGVTFLNSNPANYITGSSTNDYALTSCVGPTGVIVP